MIMKHSTLHGGNNFSILRKVVMVGKSTIESTCGTFSQKNDRGF